MALTMYPADQRAAGLRCFRDVMAQAPEELIAIALFWNTPEVEPVPDEWRNKPAFTLAGCYSGPMERREEGVRPPLLLEVGLPERLDSLPRPMAGLQYDWTGRLPAEPWTLKIAALTRTRATRSSPSRSLGGLPEPRGRKHEFVGHPL